jgi:glucose-6-phosphate 1-dehydrogenase
VSDPESMRTFQRARALPLTGAVEEPTREALRAAREAEPGGYREIAGVASDSDAETYAALELNIDNWRWAGVPFFVRNGKRQPPPAQIAVKLDPSAGIRMILDAHRADRGGPREIDLDIEFAEEGGGTPTPYEILLHAAMRGDRTHFTRQDNVEERWRIVQPLLNSPGPVHTYAPGSWGPDPTDQLLVGRGGWHRPWLEGEAP